MKKIFKKEVIIAFIIGIILASSIAVYAYSYMASDIGYTKPGTTQEISVEAALNDLYNKSSNTTLVWTNSNPTSDFSAQTINLDLSKFNYIIIETKREKNDVENSGLNPQYSLIAIGENGKIMGIDNNYAYHYIRDVSVTTSGITFGTAYGRGYNLSSINSGTDNCAIPLKIYGIKFL